MRIVIAAVSSNHHMSGVSRHAANLVKCLLTRSEVSAVHVLVATWEQVYVREAIGRNDARLHVHAVPLASGTLHRNLWYYRTLPAVARQLSADAVHIAYPSPIQRGAFSCATIVTLHDLYPYDIPSNFGFPKVLFNRMILRNCLQNATAIACVSDSTRIRLGVEMPQLLAKATTIYNCVESGPIPAIPSFAATWGDEPFILCVAQHRRNKNILLALQAFKRALDSGKIDLQTRLLVVGMKGPETQRIRGFVRASNLSGRVVLVRGVPDAGMSWCYRNCELLLAPSIVEGFGLPVVEGRLAGCRIVCSDIPAFREVAGETCRLVALGQNADARFAEAIVGSLGERRPLPAYLPSLSSAAIAQEYMGLYQILQAGAHRFGVTLEAKPAASQARPSLT